MLRFFLHGRRGTGVINDKKCSQINLGYTASFTVLFTFMKYKIVSACFWAQSLFVCSL